MRTTDASPFPRPPAFGGPDPLTERLLRTPPLVRLGGLDPAFTTARICSVGRWGPGVSAMLAAAAARYPLRPAIVDEDGPILYRDLDRQATSLAAAARGRVHGDQAVGILCRNHRGFVISHVAAERAGLDVVLLSTAFPVSRMRDVLVAEDIGVIVADREFLDLVDESVAGLDDYHPYVLVPDGDPGELDESSAPHIGRRLSHLDSALQRWGWVPPPRRRSVLTLLTSGTTGTPKGARRANRAPGAEGLALFEQVPYQIGDLYYVAPPLFHAWGLSQMTIALATASTVILRRRFDPDEAVRLLAERDIDVLAVVPLMLRRIMRAADRAEDVTDEMIAPRVVVSSGNVLSGDLSLRWMDRFGDRLYNFYGSTETGIGTIARPQDMRRAPGTVGKAPKGVTLSILDEEGMPLPPGETGTIYLSSSQQFSGYSDGSDRERTGSLMASNDLGCLDDHGLLHVNGRAGDMIVTGGENVFPNAVEEVLERQPGVDLASVVGWPDEDFGQRIVAFIVLHDEIDICIETLQAGVAAELPAFMVPKEVHVVDALPMTTTGKVIRHQLSVLGDSRRV